MPQSNEISLHAEPSLYGSSQDRFLQNENDLSVAELIPRILQERKSFLNISEELIAEEIERELMPIDAEEDFSETPAGMLENGQTPEDEESSEEKFQKQKLELLTHIGSALNETSLSLDFVSLLMSAEKPNITKSTISPHLSKTAPLGSLSADRLSRETDAAKTEQNKKLAAAIGMGWKYQSLCNVTTLFRDAAAQLRGQVAVEKTYWEQISRVLAHDEVLYKLRDPLNNSRAIGVQYGYGDSGLTYHDKGHAVLRKNANGDVSFCPLAEAGKPALNKYTRVRILSKVDGDYMLTGQLAFRKEEIEKFGEDPLISDIEKARYFLFEDDLFYHMTREAKNLISYGVSIIADKIIVEMWDQMIEFESVFYDENEESGDYQHTTAEMSRHNKKAQDTLSFLKLMLCCYFQYRVRLKQKMPTLHTKWKQANSHPLLLRPLVGHTRHQTNFRKMGQILQKLCANLDPSVTHRVTEQMYANLGGHVTSPFEKAVQRPVSLFTLVVEKSANLLLKAEVEVTTTEIFVDLVVKLTVSKFCSVQDLEGNQNGSNVLQLEFTDLIDVGESLEWTLANFIEEP